MATRPNVENLRKQAKSLHKQWMAGEASGMARIRLGLPRLSQTVVADVSGAGVTLQEVQHVIAVEHGYSNWKQLLAQASTQTGEPSRLRPRATRYIRPGLPNVQREAQWFLLMVGRGKGWSMSRIRRGLPRVAGLSDAEISRAGVTLEEAQQVVAADYGYPDWMTLEAEIGKLHAVASFEDLAELEDHEIQQVIFRLGRDRLAVALKAASERLVKRFQANMSAAAWQALAEAMEGLGPLRMSAVEVERARVLECYCSDDPLV
jgi:hypothetical protein